MKTTRQKATEAYTKGMQTGAKPFITLEEHPMTFSLSAIASKLQLEAYKLENEIQIFCVKEGIDYDSFQAEILDINVETYMDIRQSFEKAADDHFKRK